MWVTIANLDWNDKKSMDTLNKWRNQTFERDGWPSLRTEVRSPCNTKERTLCLETAKAACGRKPGGEYGGVAKEFNEYFELEGDKKRTSTSIATVDKRLIGEYERFDGEQRPIKVKVKRRRPVKKVKLAKEDEKDAWDVDDDTRDTFVAKFDGGSEGDDDD